MANHSFANPVIIENISPTATPKETDVLQCPEGTIKIRNVCVKKPRCPGAEENKDTYRCIKYTKLITCTGENKIVQRNAYTPDSRKFENWCYKGKSITPVINAENNTICACDNLPPIKANIPSVEEIPLDIEDGLLTSSLQIASMEQYMLGSLDVLFLDLYHSDNSKLLFTIEELTGEEQLLVSENLLDPKFDEKIITPQGINLSFAIKNMPEPKFLGLFICKDSNSDKRCLHKKIEEINKTLINYDIKTYLPNNYNSEDKVYFFSLMILDNKIFYPVPLPIDGNKLLHFSKLLSLDLRQLSCLRNAFMQAKKIYQILNPQPLNFSISADFKITPRIILPRLDSSKEPKAQ